MIGGIGQGLFSGLMNSQTASSGQLTSTTTTSATSTGGWINTLGGTSTSDTITITPGAHVTIQPSAPVGQMVQIVKTGDGEFILTGSGDTLGLLMDYFLQSPEMWLRLAAMKEPEENNG